MQCPSKLLHLFAMSLAFGCDRRVVVRESIGDAATGGAAASIDSGIPTATQSATATETATSVDADIVTKVACCKDPENHTCNDCYPLLLQYVFDHCFCGPSAPCLAECSSDCKAGSEFPGQSCQFCAAESDCKAVAIAACSSDPACAPVLECEAAGGLGAYCGGS